MRPKPTSPKQAGTGRIAHSCSLSSLACRLRREWEWVGALTRALRLSLGAGAPRAVGVVEGLAVRCGRRGLALAALAAAAYPLLVAGVYIGWGGAQRGRYLYYPPRWDAIRWLSESPPASAPGNETATFGVGGISEPVLPLHIMSYHARSGDTLSGIASAFGLELDTISSLNRTWGNGVHSVAIGEQIRVPNQNGIYLAVGDSLEELCRQHDVLPETVLGANGLRPSDVHPSSLLFFPGVQHLGVERELVAGTAFFFPVAGWISSGYGVRRDPFSGTLKAHYGIDIAAAAGTVVRAARSGTVWLTGEDDVFGRQVLVGHEFGYSTFYGHLDSVAVRPGQQVSSQSVIGTVGATGRATGPHLHFEIRSGGAPINPGARMAPRTY